MKMIKCTRGQRGVITRLNALIGKTFNEASLKSELNKIIPISDWATFNKCGNISMVSNYDGISFKIMVDRVSKTQFKPTKIIIENIGNS